MKKARSHSIAPTPPSGREDRIEPSSRGSNAIEGRRRWFRLGAALLVPLVGIALIELVLRLIGFGYETAFFVRHRAVDPSLRVENQRFAWRFVPHTLAKTPEFVVLNPSKPDGTCRIFVFGESAAIGDPAPAFGFSRILETLLRARYPGMQFEVVNTAFTAINSHVILPIARDCRSLQGDIWLVYMGNNEVIGPFGTGTVFGRQTPPLPVIRTSIALKRARSAQWLDQWLQRLSPSSEAALGWGGMSMFMSQQVRRDDPRLETLNRHFQRNLGDLIAVGTDARAQVVVSTMVSRLRDWPPFGSLHRIGLTETDRVEWERLYNAGVAAQTNGAFEAAIRDYESAARLDDTYADLHFQWGACCLALGQTNEAKTHLTLARDLDTLRFRTDSRHNEAIRQTVARHAGRGVRLLDAERHFERESKHGMPGEELLYEHVHFTFEGNYILARLFAEEVAAILADRAAPRSQSSAAWLASEACAARLGYTDSQRYEIAKLVRRRFDEPIYRHQLGHMERLRQLDDELASLRGHSKPVARRRAMEVCRQASASKPGDWMLHELTARLLVGLDDYSAAEAEWREVARLIPHAARSYNEIGKLLEQQGRNDQARASFARALELNPDSADAHVGLGNLDRAQGARSKAIRHFRQALRLDPTRAETAKDLETLLQSEARP